MLSKIKKFYNSTKLEKYDDTEGNIPITFTHVFHKEYPRFSSIKLRLPKTISDFDKLLSVRKSHRSFVQMPILLEELTKILYSCRITDSVTEPERRTYPSAGARFPVELYVIAFNVNNLEKGLYHYNMKQFSLEQLWRKDLKSQEHEIIPPYFHNTSVAIIFTSAISRSEIKYGIKAYPYSLIECGHMAQNIQLACTVLNIGCCPIGSFVNDAVSKILDLTKEEIPIYIMGVGKTQ